MTGISVRIIQNRLDHDRGWYILIGTETGLLETVGPFDTRAKARVRAKQMGWTKP